MSKPDDIKRMISRSKAEVHYTSSLPQSPHPFKDPVPFQKRPLLCVLISPSKQNCESKHHITNNIKRKQFRISQLSIKNEIRTAGATTEIVNNVSQHLITGIAPIVTYNTPLQEIHSYLVQYTPIYPFVVAFQINCNTQDANQLVLIILKVFLN